MTRRSEKAERVYARFNGRDAATVRRVRLDVGTPLVRIGEVPEIHYLSDKEGRLAHYYHEVDEPGTLYAHPNGEYFLLIGGSTKVREWLTENPRRGGRLSVGNINRALREFRKLPANVRDRLTDPKGFVAARAWRIQEERQHRLGHR